MQQKIGSRPRRTVSNPEEIPELLSEMINAKSEEDKDSSEFQRTWDVIHYWLSKYMFEQEITHCIRYVLPHPTSQAGQPSKKEAN